MTTKEFVERAKITHTQNYDYSKVNYINAHTKVEIICKIHGSWWVNPDNFIRKRYGCPLCNGGGYKRLTKEEFIKRAKIVHKEKYDYSEIEYKNIRTKIKIKCKICNNIFWQKPNTHLAGSGCPICGNKREVGKNAKTTEQFIAESKKIFGDKFDYSKVNYVNARTKVLLICKTCGNTFWQNPHTHLSPRGCPFCKQSTGEQIISGLLKENNISFEIEKSFPDLKDKTFLRFDFYIPSLNILIEYQGEQHYKKAGFDTHKDFLLRKHHDWLKRKYCRDHNIKLICVNEKNLNQLISQLYICKGSTS